MNNSSSKQSRYKIFQPLIRGSRNERWVWEKSFYSGLTYPRYCVSILYPILYDAKILIFMHASFVFVKWLAKPLKVMHLKLKYIALVYCNSTIFFDITDIVSFFRSCYSFYGVNNAFEYFTDVKCKWNDSKNFIHSFTYMSLYTHTNESSAKNECETN